MSRAFIIDPTISAINGLHALLGIGLPEDGGIIDSALSFFGKALDDLRSAFPGDGWLGSAADHYSGKNRKHVNFFKELAELDRELQKLIADQASAVKTTREILEDAKKGLEFVRPVAVDLTYIPIVGWAMSAAFQAPVCAAAMAVVGGALAYLVVKTLINSMKLVSLLAQLAKLLAEAVADVVSDVVDIIKGILEEVWEFLTHPFEFLKDLLNKLVSWASSLLSQWGSKLQSFFGGIPGLSGMGGGLSQLTSFFSSAGAAGSAGSVGAADSASLVSSAGLPGGLGLGGGSGFGSMPNVAQLRSAATRQDPRLTSEGPTRVSSEPVGEHAQAASAQGGQGMGGMHPASAGSKGATSKKYSEGAAAGTEDAERAPVEVGVGAAARIAERRAG